MRKIKTIDDITKDGKVEFGEGYEFVGTAEEADAILMRSTDLHGYELPEATRAARGQHVANLLEFQPGERIAEVLQIQTYQDSPYLVLATHDGKVKKSRLEEYDSARSAGLIAINLKDDDSLIGARLCSGDDDLLLINDGGVVIRMGMEDIRVCGRSSQGVRLIRMDEDMKVISMTCTAKDDELAPEPGTDGGEETPSEAAEKTAEE